MRAWPVRLRWRGQKAAVARLGLAAVGTGLAYLGQIRLEANDLALGLVWYGGALLLWIVAFAGAAWLRDTGEPPMRLLSRRAEFIALGAILLVGLFFRLYRLTAIPVGLSIDGSANALKGLDILQGAPYQPLYLSRETMYHYFMAVFFRLFGANLMGLRMTSVFFGMLGLIAFHTLARELFDSRLALIATFILATSVYHITYSRTGWRAIQVPVFQFLAFGCVLRAARSAQPKRWSNVGWWALGGAMLGLGLNTYEPFRFVVIAVGLYVASLLPRRGFLAGHWRGLLAFAACMLLFFGPLGYEAVTHWASFNARASAVFIGERMRQSKSWQPLWDNVRNALLTFNYRALGDFFDNAKPLLGRPWSILYVGGLGVLLGNLHRAKPRLLLGWFLVLLLPGVLSWPNAQRLMAATPLAFLFGGLFLYALWALLDELGWTWVGYPLLAAVGVLLVIWSYQVYLSDDRRLVWGYEAERVSVAHYLQTISESDEVLVEERYNQGQVDFFNHTPGTDAFAHRFQTFDRQRDVPVRRPVTQPLTMVLEERSENLALLSVLRSLYPDLQVDRIDDGYGHPSALAVRIPIQTVKAAWGARATYFTDEEWQQPASHSTESGLPSALPAGTWSVEWQAFLWSERLSEVDIQVTGGPVSLEIDGMVVIEDATEGHALLTRGLHALRLRGVATSFPAGAALLWRTGGGSYRQIQNELLFAVETPDSSLLGSPARREVLAWQQVWSIGGHGTVPGQFFRPMNLVTDSAGHLYVADSDNRRIQKLRAEDGSFVAEWGRLGVEPGDLEHDMAVALGSDDVLVVSDRWNDRVQTWSTGGEFLGVIVPQGLVLSPRAVVSLPGGDFLVSSPGHRQIRRFGPNGSLVASWGQPGTERGQFVEPAALAYDPHSHTVYVADAAKRTIQSYAPDGSFLAEWPVSGISWESYVAVDAEGRVHVTAPDENTVYIFDTSGTMLVWGTEATQFQPFNTPLNHPMGITFDEQGDLYLTSTWSDRVLRFARVPAEELAATISPNRIEQPPPEQPELPFEPRFLYKGNTQSRAWEEMVGAVTVSGGSLSVRVAAVPYSRAVYDYLRFVGDDGQEHRFEAEDTTVTQGDDFRQQAGADGHWWVQEFDSFSSGRGLVADALDAAPPLETTIGLPDGDYQMFLGTFTGDPASGPFALALDY